MPLEPGTVSLLTFEHVRAPLKGPALLLGRLKGHYNVAEMIGIMRGQGFVPPDLPEFRDPEVLARRATDVEFFRLLGIDDLRGMDFSDYEGADYIQDLNKPLAEPSLVERFGFVLDPGTLEHVFDVRQAMMNMASLVKPGGKILHVSPVNNYVNHGFYQFSPTLYFDYYEANGFEDLHAMMAVHPRQGHETQLWNVFQYDYNLFGGLNSLFCDGESMLAMFFSARKTAASTVDRVPIQKYFRVFNTEELFPGNQYLLSYDKEGLKASLLE